MSELLAIAHSLRDAAREEWKVDQEVRFRPLIDLSLGHVCSDLAYELGEVLRQNPQGIGETLLGRSALPQVRSQEGFLNIEVSDLLFPKELFSAEFPREVSVVVPAPTLELQGWEYLRLLSGALLQSLLLERKSAVTLRIGTSIHTGKVKVREAIEQALAMPMANREENEQLLASLLESTPSDMFLWLSPHSLERTRFQNLYRRYLHGVKHRTLCCPEKRWFSGIDTKGKDPLEVMKGLPDTVLLPMLLHLAGPVPACDLDLAIPHFRENANLFSFLHTTLERLERFSGLGWRATTDSELSLEREIIIRARLLPHLVDQARARGETRSLLAGLELLLRPVNRLINMPSFRAAVERGKMEGEGALEEAAFALRQLAGELPFNKGYTIDLA